MNQENFQKIYDETICEAKAILISKGKEYADNEDRLANFKDIARDLGITSEQVCLTYLEKHMRAIKNCSRAGRVSKESETRIADCINYLCFLQALQIEKKEEEKEAWDKLDPASVLEKETTTDIYAPVTKEEVEEYKTARYEEKFGKTASKSWDSSSKRNEVICAEAASKFAQAKESLGKIQKQNSKEWEDGHIFDRT